MGIDWGEKRIGIALSDPLKIISQRFKTVEFKSKDSLLEEIKKIIKEKEVGKIVVGLPRRTDGRVGKSEKKVNNFIEWLSKSLKIDIVKWDERYTSVLAGKITKDKKILDALSAQIMLQSYLESLR